MKKISIFSLLIVASLGFVGCAKVEITDQNKQHKSNFTLFATVDSDLTKTTNDAKATKWAADDAINVFHAEAGTTNYSSNSEFTLEEGTTGTFTGTVSELSESNDWYALYPYSSYLESPDNTVAWFYIGCSYSHSSPQKQTGNDSMAHLAGEYYPLWAQAKGVVKDDPVSLTFRPVVGVVKFHVTNNSGAPLTVSTIALTAEQEDIVGRYYISFSGESPVLTASSSYVSKKDSLEVSGGAAIDDGESADFYMAIKPFSNTEGNKLTFSVNGYAKFTTAAISFKAGQIKTVNFNYDKEIKVLEPGTYVALIENEAPNYYAMSRIDAETSTKRLKSIDVEYDGSGNFTTTDDSIVWNVTKEDGKYYFENGGEYVSWSGSGSNASMSSSKYALNVVEDGDYFKVMSVADNAKILSRNKVDDNKYFAFYDAGQKHLFTFVSATLKIIPIINPITNPDKVAAAGATDVEVSYTITNPVEGKSVSAVSAESWVNGFNYDTAGKIIFTVDENTTAEERTSVVTVSYEGADDVTFTVTQSAAGTVSTTYTFSFASAVSGWPTSSSSEGDKYIYTLDKVDYTFVLDASVYCKSSYLMVSKNNNLGLPALAGKKLIKVVVTNSSGCSTSTKVSITDGSSAVSGGAQQTWSDTSTDYTYSLSGTKVNTVYYISVSNKNAQIVNLKLTYE